MSSFLTDTRANWQKLFAQIRKKEIKIYILEGTACLGKSSFVASVKEVMDSSVSARQRIKLVSLDFMDAAEGTVLLEKHETFARKMTYHHLLARAFEESLTKAVRYLRKGGIVIFDRAQDSDFLYNTLFEQYDPRKTQLALDTFFYSYMSDISEFNLLHSLIEELGADYISYYIFTSSSYELVGSRMLRRGTVLDERISCYFDPLSNYVREQGHYYDSYLIGAKMAFPNDVNVFVHIDVGRLYIANYVRLYSRIVNNNVVYAITHETADEINDD